MNREFKEALKDLKIFRGNLDPSAKEILEQALGCKLEHKRPLTLYSDGVTLMKEKGCFGGPCECTGRCKQLVEYSSLDLLRDQHCEEEKRHSTIELLSLMVDHIGEEALTFMESRLQ